MFFDILEGSNVLESILKLFRSFRWPVATVAIFCGGSNLRNVDKACDKIDHSES